MSTTEKIFAGVSVAALGYAYYVTVRLRRLERLERLVADATDKEHYAERMVAAARSDRIMESATLCEHTKLLHELKQRVRQHFDPFA